MTTPRPVRGELRGDRVEQAEVLARAVRADREHVGPLEPEAAQERRRVAGRPRSEASTPGAIAAPARVEAEQLDELAAHVLGGRDHEPRAAGDARHQRAMPGAVCAPVPGRVVERRDVVDHDDVARDRRAAPCSRARAAARDPRAASGSASCSQAWPGAVREPGRAAGSRCSARAAARAGGSTARAPSARRRRSRAARAARALIATGAAVRTRAGAARRRSRAASPRRSPAGTAGRPVRRKRGRGGLLGDHRLSAAAPRVAPWAARVRRPAAGAGWLLLRPVRLIGLPERVGVLLVARALGHRGGGQGEHGHGEKQCSRRRMAAKPSVGGRPA